MLNTTHEEVVFRMRGLELDQAVRAALRRAAEALVTVYGAERLDLNSVTTKTNVRLGFAKFVLATEVLQSKKRFDEDYVRQALRVDATAADAVEPSEYGELVRAKSNSKVPFKPAYKLSIRSGIALTLVALHSAGAITLPFSFNWPGAKKPGGRRIDFAPYVAAPLLQLIRSVSVSGRPGDPVFEAVLTDNRRRLWFTSNCTKLLLATGWLTPEDVNLKDLLALKDANDATNFSRCKTAIGFRALIDVLERRYGSKRISVRSWDQALNSAQRLEAKTERLLSKAPVLGADEAFGMPPSTAYTERLARLTKLPGLEGDFGALSKVWLRLEAAYLNKIRLEKPVNAKRALGFLNLYLFFYLPYWFQAHPTTKLHYPSTPALLTSGLFVSPLIELEFETPDTFVDFMERYASEREWHTTSRQHYAAIRDVQAFFAFLEQNAKELPGCLGFTQPLSSHDMPGTTRLRGTNKRPIPAKQLAFFVAYVNSLVDYFHVVLGRVLSGQISQVDVKEFGVHQFVVDTCAVGHLVGFVPCVFFEGRLFRLQFVPNIFDLRQHRLKDGRYISIPTPHGIHHTCVATLTGIRGQHVRWLDEETFDSMVSETERQLTLLLVNTDKKKKEAWTPLVNLRTVEVLRMQRAWRQLIDCPAFEERVHYNRNKKSKWGTIKPLFSDGLDGYPHAPSRYEKSWGRVLLGFQSLLADAGLKLRKPLCELLPSPVPYDAPDRDVQLAQFASSRRPLVKLIPKGDITPHSARVAVVTNLMTFLPPDFIGEKVTGQTEAVVNYYSYVDPDITADMQREQQLAVRLNTFALEAPGQVGNTAPHPRYTNPADINSNFARSLRSDVGETIAAYACISLVWKPGAKSGVDVLRETRGADAAFNRTEVCPFGNNCPPDVVKELKGFRVCARCWYAVRSVDHLPPVEAKIKFEMIRLKSLEERLDDAAKLRRQPTEELEQLESERQAAAFDLACWKAIAEILEAQRQRLEQGFDSRRWVVQKPELLAQALKRVPVRTGSAEYLLALLGECVAYEGFGIPEVNAKIDLLRRQILADMGKVREALVSRTPTFVGAEVFGLLRSLAKVHNLTVDDFARTLEGEAPQPLTQTTMLNLELI